MSRTTYDETPYVTGPHYSTHPDHLATTARLMGLSAPSPEQCRVLELGCGDGGNLIPMALELPDSEFLGIDLSSTQIEAGRNLIDRLGLSNIELRTANVMEFSTAEGQFDYIACHGVFSWVPASVQHQILEICRTQLHPTGVAHISYNAYPGWHFRAIVRDMLLFETRDLQGPEQKVGQARAYLRFLRDSLPDNSPLGPLIASACDTFDESPDWYLLHEYLEEDNHPFYFHEFMQLAQQHELQYLGEGWFHTRLEDFPPETQKTIRDISESWLQIEQHVDFLSTRTFRRTLLCHAEAKLPRQADMDRVSQMSASALAQPLVDSGDVLDDSVMKFRREDGRILSTNSPLLKVALSELWHSLPACVPTLELYQAVNARLEPVGKSAPAAEMLGGILKCYLGNLLTLHSAPPRFAMTAGKMPTASPLARAQAEHRSVVANLRHQLIDVPPLQRVILQYLDGRHTREQLLPEMQGALEQGQVTLEQCSPEQCRTSDGQSILQDLLEQSLHRFAQNALLMPD